MWKRDNEPAPPPTPAAAPSSAPRSDRAERSDRIEPEPPVARAAESASRAVIGASLELQGDLSGNEDLLVEGRVQGRSSSRSMP